VPKTPLDRLPKLARTISCTIVTDAEKADAYETALIAHQAKEQELAASFPRRAAAVRASLPVTMTTEEASETLQHLRDADIAALTPTLTAVQAAEVELDTVRERWVFRSLGRTAWKALQAKHPATEDDQEAWTAAGGEGKPAYSFETIARDLITAATVTPTLTPGDVEEMFDGDTWNDAEIATLFQYAVIAQTQARPDPKARR
jgi:hypothetical protein